MPSSLKAAEQAVALVPALGAPVRAVQAHQGRQPLIRALPHQELLLRALRHRARPLPRTA